MADGHWNPQMIMHHSAGMLKRPRPDSDLPPSGMPSAHMQNYLPRDAHTGHQLAKDPKATGSVYDRYLQNVQLPYTSGEASNFGGLVRAVGGGMPGFSIAGSTALGRSGAAGGPDLAPNGRAVGFGGQLPLDAMARPGRETALLPPDASNTLYVEGLPSNCTKREVAHIFRPFVGYKEVRLVSKESRHRDGDPLILCFVDFTNPACAATALSALQGYRMDEHDRDSAYLRLQFSKNPGPRSGSGSGSGGSGRRRKR